MNKKSFSDRMILAMLLWCLLFFCPSVVISQEIALQADAAYSMEEAEALVTKLGEDPALTEEDKTQLQSIQKTLEEMKELKGKLLQYQEMIKSVPQQIEKVNEELEAAVPEPVNLRDASIAELEQQLSVAMAELKGAQDLLVQLEGEPQKRVSRRMKIPEELTQLQQLEFRVSPDDIDLELAGNDDNNEISSLISWVSKRLRELKVQVLEQELASYDARSRLLPLRRDLAAKKVEALTSKISSLRKELDNRRRVEADQTAMEARLTEANVHPELAELASENTKLADRRSGKKGVLDEIARLDKKLQELGAEERRLEIRFEELKKRVDIVGLTNATGLLLQKEMGELPNISEHQQEIHLRKASIPDLHLEIIEVQSQRDRLADGLDEEVERLVEEIAPSVSSPEKQQLESEIRSLLTERLELYNSLLIDYDSYFSRTVDLDTRQRRMVNLVESFIDYVDRRLLWVRGPSSLSWEMVANTGEGVFWFFSPGNWRAVGRAFSEQAKQNPAMNILIFILFLMMYAFQGKLKDRLKVYSEEKNQKRNIQFSPTIKALAVSMILLVPVPIVFALIANALKSVNINHPFPSYLAEGLTRSMYIFVPWYFLCLVCRKDGLGEAHFQWSADAMRALYKKLIVITPLITIVAIIAYSVMLHSNISWRIAVGAWCSILIQLGVSWLVFWSLNPRGIVLRGVLSEGHERILNQISFFWRPLLAGFPLFLVLLALFGWTFGAMALSEIYIYSLLLLLFVIILRSLVLGWTRVQYRQIKIREAHKRLEKIRTEQERSETAIEPVDLVENDAVDMQAADQQLRRLMNIASIIIVLIGLRALWDNVLPALKRFDTVYLWERSVSLSDFIDTSSGTTELKNQLVSQAYVTLNDLIIAVVIFAVTFTAVRNLPGMAEVVVLRRFNIDKGVRFAIITFLRYSLVMVGAVIGFGVLGIGWSKVQWLAAAVSVGLGFGLQEIFANFVSGMIILLERPIRLGDIVTVGETSGVVTQIRMRATVITDWDQRELLVPNKEFVTGRLINWTLTDPMTRVHIDVGLAYGSDTVKAREIMKDIAMKQPYVTDDPEPMTAFLDFGDSSLHLRLYAYMPDRSMYLVVVSDLRTEIDRRFKEAGIVIAFPQLDVHLDRVENNDQN